MPSQRDSQLDAAIAQRVDAEARRQMNEVVFGLQFDRAVLCGLAEEEDRELYAELHRHDPEGCREALAREWGATT